MNEIIWDGQNFLVQLMFDSSFFTFEDQMRAFKTDFIFETFVHIGRQICIYMVDYKHTT